MKKFMVLLVLVAITGGGWYVWQQDKADNADITASGSHAKSFDNKQHSLDDPASIWVIANKHRPLQPHDYEPSDLVAPNMPLRLTAKDEEMLVRTEVANALEEMNNAAKKDGLSLMVSSAYRSYGYQKGLYNRYVNQQGQVVADTQSARPGYSEHQTGLAVDIEPTSRACEVEECFGDLPEGKWVAKNAYKYGFVIRYQKSAEGTTGYIYEPWHLRYVGKPLAGELHKKGDPPLEAFFGLEASPDYK